MSFNIGLSALAAAQEEIAVTGNNIANASTNGFKSSRTEFADVFAASVLGGGASQTGGGVGVQAISQNFSQGNITFTDNTLDLAINGNGFFILRGEDGNVFTRAGSFGTDRNGNIVNSLGEKLQGFAATPDGKASGGGPLTDLVVTTGRFPLRQRRWSAAASTSMPPLRLLPSLAPRFCRTAASQAFPSSVPAWHAPLSYQEPSARQARISPAPPRPAPWAPPTCPVALILRQEPVPRVFPSASTVVPFSPLIFLR